MKVRDKAKELNLYGIPLDWKEHSFKDFLEHNGYRIINDDYEDFEYSDCKAYLEIEIVSQQKRQAQNNIYGMG